MQSGGPPFFWKRQQLPMIISLVSLQELYSCVLLDRRRKVYRYMCHNGEKLDDSLSTHYRPCTYSWSCVERFPSRMWSALSYHYRATKWYARAEHVYTERLKACHIRLVWIWWLETPRLCTNFNLLLFSSRADKTKRPSERSVEVSRMNYMHRISIVGR